MRHDLNRRTVLRGLLNGGAITLALPMLDMFLDDSGTALASGAPIPVRFGTWFWGLGVTPQRWIPNTIGPNYDLKEELQPLAGLSNQVSVFSGFDVKLDGKSNYPHQTGWVAFRTGVTPGAGQGITAPTFDVLIGDAVGTSTRFRSLEVAANGDPRNSLSGRPGSVNPAESSPALLYRRIFGPDFVDPNKADFKPDPMALSRQSVLSAVSEKRARLMNAVGSSDRARLDQYFTSLRQLEQQISLSLEKPAPLEACVSPHAAEDKPVGNQLEQVIENHKMMAKLLAMALACNQTRVFNVTFNNPASSLTHLGSTISHHQLTHEEPIDTKLGFQPSATAFLVPIMGAWATFVGELAAIREGAGTLLDNSVVVAHTECQWAKYHSIEGMPTMVAGKAGGKLKSGIHVAGKGDAITRVGLTAMQAMGVPVDRFGTGSMTATKPIGEILA